ncbi:hypothetical protein DFH27DRAFT_652855 [Peziza echinospora]|nr:hypothetical protein DFH27DRAFT_652855 [Peziza echinospora]
MGNIPPLTASLLSILHTTLYVGVLYLSPLTRPKIPKTPNEQLANLHNDPTVIRYRIRAVTFATLISTAITAVVLWLQRPGEGWEGALGRMGIVPDWGMGWEGWRACVGAVGLVVTLFVGSLWEKVVVGEGWRWEEVRREWEGVWKGWMGWRNLIVGPLTEEIVFRACMVPLHIAAGTSPMVIVFTTPLYFGIAHIHHLYEFHLRNPGRLLTGILRSLFQFTYTTIFGWLATFLYMRTGSVWAVVLVHSFCNHMGVPNFGRVSESYSWLGWGRWVDYVGWFLHVLGLTLFWRGRWTWTEGGRGLVEF